MLQAEPRTRTHAVAEIMVHDHQSTAVDVSAEPALSQLRLEEGFTGEMEGESSVLALQVKLGDRSAHMVSMQRFRGKLGGREGSFVLQGSEIIEQGKISAKWSVVPGSGTGQLSGLRGEGGFEGDFGKGSTGTLDYWFE